MRWAPALVTLSTMLLAGCLEAVELPTPDEGKTPATSGLAFRAPVDLGSFQYLFAGGTSCRDYIEDRDGDCGLSEAQVEVDGRGTIYVSGVCCIGPAPPVYVSRDGGQTFQLLKTDDGIRERFGVEGDFAIDDLGRVYFADIEVAATFQVTVWDAEGKYLRHTKWPAPPLVDRDWIRAEGDGKLYYVYNTGAQTNVYISKDGGSTWSAVPVYSAPFNLGTATLGPTGNLWILGGSQGGTVRAAYTTDGGASWNTKATTLPASSENTPGAFDEGGNLYATASSNKAIHVARRSTDGTWHPPIVISPAGGTNRMPWIAAGAEGAVAVCWYGTTDKDGGGPWMLHVASSTNAHTSSPTFDVVVADPSPIFEGRLQRELLDFIQCEIGPDGAVHVSYSRLPKDRADGEEQMQFVRSEAAPFLAPIEFPSGPHL